MNIVFAKTTNRLLPERAEKKIFVRHNMELIRELEGKLPAEEAIKALGQGIEIDFKIQALIYKVTSVAYQNYFSVESAFLRVRGRGSPSGIAIRGDFTGEYKRVPVGNPNRPCHVDGKMTEASVKRKRQHRCRSANGAASATARTNMIEEPQNMGFLVFEVDGLGKQERS
jgi:hypothetical protein